MNGRNKSVINCTAYPVLDSLRFGSKLECIQVTSLNGFLWKPKEFYCSLLCKIKMKMSIIFSFIVLIKYLVMLKLKHSINWARHIHTYILQELTCGILSLSSFTPSGTLHFSPSARCHCQFGLLILGLISIWVHPPISPFSLVCEWHKYLMGPQGQKFGGIMCNVSVFVLGKCTATHWNCSSNLIVFVSISVVVVLVVVFFLFLSICVTRNANDKRILFAAVCWQLIRQRHLWSTCCYFRFFFFLTTNFHFHFNFAWFN